MKTTKKNVCHGSYTEYYADHAVEILFKYFRCGMASDTTEGTYRVRWCNSNGSGIDFMRYDGHGINVLRGDVLLDGKVVVERICDFDTLKDTYNNTDWSKIPQSKCETCGRPL